MIKIPLICRPQENGHTVASILRALKRHGIDPVEHRIMWIGRKKYELQLFLTNEDELAYRLRYG
jgi:hypothetical protein